MSMHRLFVREIYRLVRGQSAAILVRASDDEYYVVKRGVGPSGGRGLVNEYLATSLAREIGLSVPRTALIQITEDVISASDTQSWPRPIAPDLCFGSRLPSRPPEGQIFDYLPRGLMQKVENPDFAAASWLFDVWTSNGEEAQAIFIPTRAGRSYRGFKISHALSFGGSTWCCEDQVRSFSRWQLLLHQQAWKSDVITACLSRIRALNEDRLQAIASSIPSEWIDSPIAREACDSLLCQLADRAAGIHEHCGLSWPEESIPLPNGLSTRSRTASAR